jgi:Spy/CpxP family protein refolding chaperone
MRTIRCGLVAALALGGLLTLTNVASAQDAKEGKKGRFSPEQRLEQLTKDLSLTDAQKPKVKAVLEDTSKKRAELQNVDQSERREKGRALMEDENKKMKEILTPEQNEKYLKIQAENRGRGKKKSGDEKKE